MPDPVVQAGRKKARQRYEHFIAAVGRRLREGPKFRQEIVEDVEPEGR
jgi:hypothetical protein